ncbi:MAG: UMP kinase [Candidatus Omnitrophica bacterium]|nr:MAG: Uridylate kinase [Candidatus Hinthialibacteria bacterium OLB16]MBE7489148.1 UMP kinase [bacterium]MBK7494683.1 UMP kinase [Candidatus Omnitrophota bacterium]MCE7909124.1 UMP kinase [Candidatus Omnitrophica bacterium COP1]MBV6480955.1 Uridylate kinase [bacterium]
MEFFRDHEVVLSFSWRKTPVSYRRILLKLSGESLGDKSGRGIDTQRVSSLAEQVARISRKGVQVGIVIGGGNLWRGARQMDIDRTTSDMIGMLATVMNGLALQAVIEQAGAVTRLQSALSMDRVAEPYIRRRSIRHLEKGRVVIFAAGTGNPYFTTDTAAALRANEISAEVLLKATTVDGVYDKDPKLHPDARLFSCLTYQQVFERDLRVMDMTAITLCQENNMPLIIFNMDKPHAVEAVVEGNPVGTFVGSNPPRNWQENESISQEVASYVHKGNP